jgi:hypothetical protein
MVSRPDHARFLVPPMSSPWDFVAAEAWKGGGGRWDSFSGLVTMWMARIRLLLTSILNTDWGRPLT